MFAANGYVVLDVNYRGSNGRGCELPEGDLRRLGQQGSRSTCSPASTRCDRAWASPIRIAFGIGGWSYGGILTDYTIASDDALQGGDSAAPAAR